LLAFARHHSLITIMDAKRGDIDSTMAGYADAYLRPDSPLEVDALTLSPYLGFDSLAPALDIAAEHGKGVFVLALTSNPEGASVQHSRNEDGVAVAAMIALAAAERNRGESPMGSVGLVVGATVGDAIRALEMPLSALNGPILAPGVGAQGAGPEELAQVFKGVTRNVLSHQSRAVLMAGPIQQAAGAAQFALRGDE
jgi:orotidine-5'-phosphate decarboxylase